MFFIAASFFYLKVILNALLKALEVFYEIMVPFILRLIRTLWLFIQRSVG